MTLSSCLYRGSVMHRRLRPRTHRFRYRAFWMLLDLDELSTIASRLRIFSQNRFNLFSLYDTDHGDGSTTPLRTQAERHLARAGIDVAGGPIRLFCMPRTLGYSFNPLSIYFCHRPGGELAAIIYQVHNTFGERHAYVAEVNADAAPINHGCRKAFRVSPFLAMDLSYKFRLNQPGDGFELGIAAYQHGQAVLSACLAASRQELGDRALLRNFAAIPFVTAKVILAIHWEALRLWLKGIRPPANAHGTTLAAISSRKGIDPHAL